MSNTKKDLPITPNSEQPLNRRLISFSNDFLKVSTYWIIYETCPIDSMLTRYNQHTFYELQFVLEGGIEQFVDVPGGERRTFRLEPNEFVIVAPGYPHQITEAKENSVKFKLGFDCESKSVQIDFALDRLKEPVKYVSSERTRKYVDLMRETVSSRATWSTLQMNRQLECLVLDLFETVYSSSMKDYPPPKMKINRPAALFSEVRCFIQDHLLDSISVETVAAGVGLSSRQINRVLAASFQTTIGDLIRKEKLQYIKELVASTGLTFSEIAEVCGYSNEYALNRFFKEAEGYTLSQYRYMVLHSK